MDTPRFKPQDKVATVEGWPGVVMELWHSSTSQKLYRSPRKITVGTREFWYYDIQLKDGRVIHRCDHELFHR